MLVSVVLFVLSLLSLSSAQSTTSLTQYIVNGGFETGSLPPWTASVDPGVGASVVANSAQFPSHSGAYSLQFGLRNAGAGATAVANVSQAVVVPRLAGTQFLLSFYYVGPQIVFNNPTAVGFMAYVTFNGVPVQFINSTNSRADSNGYVQYTGIVIEPVLTGNTAVLTLTFSSFSVTTAAQIDDVTLIAPSITGDPQFVGLRGQSYQVHGMDGEVYNLITDKALQVNSRFVFLSAGECPMINGKATKNCWSHPGSYLGAVGVQQVVDGKVEQLAITAGPAATGFASIMLNGDAMKVGESYTNGAFSVQFVSAYQIDVTTELFTFQFDSSDMFINQQVKANVPLSTLTSHGLFGQTHQRKVFNSALRYIEGEVDDYVVASQDLFGADCMYNKFSL